MIAALLRIPMTTTKAMTIQWTSFRYASDAMGYEAEPEESTGFMAENE
jgi:hypothetical protein